MPYIPPNTNNDSLPKKNKERAPISKGTTTSNQYLALHIEEGEIPSTNITLEGDEIEECGDPTPSTLPNASEDGIEKTLARFPSPGIFWEAMVKKSISNLMVDSPSHSSSQGSQEIPDQVPPPSTRGRKTQRHHREWEVKRELELGRRMSIEETKLLQNTRSVEGIRADNRSRVGPQPKNK